MVRSDSPRRDVVEERAGLRRCTATLAREMNPAKLTDSMGHHYQSSKFIDSLGPRIDKADSCLLVDMRGRGRTIGAARGHVVVDHQLFLVGLMASPQPQRGDKVSLVFGENRAARDSPLLHVTGHLVPVLDSALITYIQRLAGRNALRRACSFPPDELAENLATAGSVDQFLLCV